MNQPMNKDQAERMMINMAFGALAIKYGEKGVIHLNSDDIAKVDPMRVAVIQDGDNIRIMHLSPGDFMRFRADQFKAEAQALEVQAAAADEKAKVEQEQQSRPVLAVVSNVEDPAPVAG